MKIKARHAAITAAIYSVFGATNAAYASNALEEIVVTATRQVESLQDTPVAVTAYSESALENQRISSLGDLTVQAPSLQAYDFPTSTTNIALFLRGFGNSDSQTLTIDNPVGLYIDDVYIGRTSGAAIDILDLERVEILRGPQGTLFGRNSSAGAINFITKKPGDELAGRGRLGIGNYGEQSLSGWLDIPISQDLAIKVSAGTSSRDGWVKNSGDNDTAGQPTKNFYERDSKGYRIALDWQPSDSVDVFYSYDWSSVDSTPPYFQSQNQSRQKRTTHLFTGEQPFRFVLPQNENEFSGHNLTINLSLNDAIQLRSITGYRNMEERNQQNWADSIFFATDLDWETESFSQEFQIIGNAAEGKFNYIAGLYYYKEDGDKYEEQFTNGAGLPDTIILDPLAQPLVGQPLGAGGTSLGAAGFDTELESKAIFAQGTLSLMDSRLDLTAGIRYTEDERKATRFVDPLNPSISFPPGSNDDSYNHTDYNLTAAYAWTEEVNTYVRIATGYRAGGSAERALDFSQTFEPEENLTYEIGLKSEWLERSLRVNAAVFESNYDDLLLTISGEPPLYASFNEVFNAGKATISGIELDVTYLLTDQLSMTLNYAYLDWELKDLIVPDTSFLKSGPPASNVDERGLDISGDTHIIFAPEHAYTIALDYSIPMNFGEFNLHVDYAYRDDMFTQIALGAPVNDLGLLNARIDLAGLSVGNGEMKVSLWGRNLTDESEQIYDLLGLGFQFNTPRTYGAELSYEF